MHSPHPISLDELARHFGVSTALTPVAANDNHLARPGSEVAPSFELVAEVMAELPNGDHYDRADWTRFAHMLCGCCIGTQFEADVRELFLDWSSHHWTSDPAKDLAMWNSVHSPHTGWRHLLETLERTNPKAYNRINLRLAREAFADLNGSVADVLRPIPDWVAEMNQRFATVTSINGVLDLDPVARGDAPFCVMPYTHFRTYHDNRWVDAGGKNGSGAGTAWLKHPQRRSYNSLGMWLPGSEPVGALNLFHGLPMPNGPATVNASCALILEFFHKVVAAGRDLVNDYVLNWFAWKLQHPLEKPGTNLILFGGQGTGKSTTGLFLLSMCGRQYSLHLTSDHQLLGNFNGHMEGKLVVLADEALFGGNPAVAGRYKALTTEDTMTVEHKGLTARQVANRMAFIFCSNSSTAVPVEAGDRRATVLQIEKQPGVDVAYFKRLWEQWDDFGREAFMDFLLARDVSKFDPRVPLETPEKLSMASSTADSFTLFWLDRVANPEPLAKGWDTAGVFISTPDLEGDYRQWCSSHQRRAASSAEIQVRLDALCPESHHTRLTKPPRLRGRNVPSADRCLALAQQALGGSAPPDPSSA